MRIYCWICLCITIVHFWFSADSDISNNKVEQQGIEGIAFFKAKREIVDQESLPAVNFSSLQSKLLTATLYVMTVSIFRSSEVLYVYIFLINCIFFVFSILYVDY